MEVKMKTKVKDEGEASASIASRLNVLEATVDKLDNGIGSLKDAMIAMRQLTTKLAEHQPSEGRSSPSPNAATAANPPPMLVRADSMPGGGLERRASMTEEEVEEVKKKMEVDGADILLALERVVALEASLSEIKAGMDMLEDITTKHEETLKAHTTAIAAAPRAKASKAAVTNSESDSEEEFAGDEDAPRPKGAPELSANYNHYSSSDKREPKGQKPELTSRVKGRVDKKGMKGEPDIFASAEKYLASFVPGPLGIDLKYLKGKIVCTQAKGAAKDLGIAIGDVLHAVGDVEVAPAVAAAEGNDAKATEVKKLVGAARKAAGPEGTLDLWFLRLGDEWMNVQLSTNAVAFGGDVTSGAGGKGAKKPVLSDKNKDAKAKKRFSMFSGLALTRPKGADEDDEEEERRKTTGAVEKKGGLGLREMLALRRGSVRDTTVLKDVDKKSGAGGAALGETFKDVDGASKKKKGVRAAKSQSLEISEEEKAMNGAPEGELFVVEAVERSALPKFKKGEDPETVLELALEGLEEGEETGSPPSVAWNVLFDALTALRRIIVHAPGQLDNTIVMSVLSGLTAACRSSRSVVSRNALLCVADLFFACGGPKALDLLTNENYTADVVGALLDAAASNQPKSSKLGAAAALAQACDAATRPSVLKILAPALAAGAGHKNKDSAALACSSCLAALRSLQGTDTAFAKALDLQLLLPPLVAGLNGKSPEGKKAAKACCALVAASLGGEAYKAAVGGLKRLKGSAVNDLVKAGGADGGEAKTKSGGMSMFKPWAAKKEGDVETPPKKSESALRVSASVEREAKEMFAEVQGGMLLEDALEMIDEGVAEGDYDKKKGAAIKARLKELQKPAALKVEAEKPKPKAAEPARAKSPEKAKDARVSKSVEREAEEMFAEMQNGMTMEEALEMIDEGVAEGDYDKKKGAAIKAWLKELDTRGGGKETL